MRIDDTDAERSRSDYESEIMRDMRWLGINWDEGPDMTLPFGPYRQSERFDIYREWVMRLLNCGAAYKCYCSDERLETLRESQRAAGLPPKYDGLCRNLTQAQQEDLESSGVLPCIRFIMPESVTVKDMLHGDYTLNGVGDFVIERSNGHPIYLFTSVIDDHLMKITHIIRGDEHLPNAVRQQAIFDALKLEAPQFAHIPMILGADRHKLSKRTGSQPISSYRDNGFFADAMCVYLASLSHPACEGVPDMDELAKAFSLDKISSSAPVHDEEHLLHYQKLAMERRSLEWACGELFDCEPRLATFAQNAENAQNNDFYELIADIKKESATIQEMLNALDFLILPESAAHSEPWFGELAAELQEIEWRADEINAHMRAWQKSRGIKPKEFFHPLRAAFTAKDKGAPLPLIMSVMGRDRILKILQK